MKEQDESWREHWKDMPEFVMKQMSQRKIAVLFPDGRKVVTHFRNKDVDVGRFAGLIGQTIGEKQKEVKQESVDGFAKLMEQNITPRQKAIWFPKWEPRRYADKLYEDEGEPHVPQFPIYIVSKGRWDSRQTSKALEKMNVPYHIVVEAHEFDQYAAVIDPKKILVLPEKYKAEYNTCDSLGLTKSTGPGAARNFCWDDSVSKGFAWHWVMDDNIPAFGRINRSLYVHVKSGTIFKIAEDFVLRYSNIAQAGFNYDFLAKTKTLIPPYVLNTRIYSCLLIRNDIPFRWRGRYNEDTDLSLRVMQAGLVTVQFNAFIQEKATTQTVKGGNDKDFYSVEGTRPKSEMLKKLQPDYTEIVERYGRVHHQVNYKPFKGNELKLKEGLVIPDRVNDYGLKCNKEIPF